MSEARPYHSPRRQRQAEQTRTEILATARRLFSERGYAATPISAVAGESGVSVPTLYSSVGSKAQIALSLVEFINDEVDMTGLAAAQAAAETPADLLRANARLTRVLNERCGDIIRALLSAAAADAGVAAAEAEGRRVHREGSRGVVEQLHAMNGLRNGLSVDQGGAILTTLTAPESVDRLTREHGWSFDDLEEWLAEASLALLASDYISP